MGELTVNSLPFEDRSDFENADRGLIGSLDPGVVKNASGRVVWDNDAFGFLQADCPETANPSLWRQSQLCARQGLFEVAEGIYQLRGLDLSNMTIVEGDRGVIVIDPLIHTPHDEVAEAVEASLDRERVRRCLEGLTEVQRESITLAYYGGYSYRQVSELLKVTLGAIKTRIRDGLIRMRDCLGVN